MPITRERLQQTFSEGGAREIYQEVKALGDFRGFTRRYVFDADHRVARSALWGLTKASDRELAELQVLLNALTDLAMQTGNTSVRRLTLSIIERMKMQEHTLRTDFLDFCLEHMASVGEPPGVQALCMKLAFRMCQFYPELSEELRRTLESMDADSYKPAVVSLTKKILSGKYR